MKKYLHVALALALSAAGLWWALRDVDLREAAEACRRARGLWLFALVPLWTGVEFVLRSLRWSWLLERQAPLPYGRVFSLTTAGFFLNNVLPFRAGEAARLYWTHRETGMPPASAAAVLGLDRFFDLLALVTLLAVTIKGLGRFPGAAPSAAVFGAVAAGGTLFLWIAARNPVRAAAAARRMRMPERLCRWVEEFSRGAAPVADARSFFKIYLLSLGLWAGMSAFYGVMSRVFGLDLSPLEAAGLVLSFSVGAAVPAAPGYVGTMEAAGVTFLTALGRARADIVPFVLSVHLLQFVSVALYGAPALISLRQRGAAHG